MTLKEIEDELNKLWRRRMIDPNDDKLAEEIKRLSKQYRMKIKQQMRRSLK